MLLLLTEPKDPGKTPLAIAILKIRQSLPLLNTHHDN